MHAFRTCQPKGGFVAERNKWRRVVGSFKFPFQQSQGNGLLSTSFDLAHDVTRGRTNSPYSTRQRIGPNIEFLCESMWAAVRGALSVTDVGT
jgi:hypothetical protein